MARPQGGSTVGAWSIGDVRLERYRHAPGPSQPIPPHTHAEYQFGLSLDAPGEYHYRGTRHPIPAGALRLVQPGEVHASRDFGGPGPAVTHLLYVPPTFLRDITGGDDGGAVADPVFRSPVVPDPDLAARFLTLCATLADRPTSALARDALLLETLAAFAVRHAEEPPVPAPVGREPRAVALVRAYLEERAAEDVPLARLAALAGLSPYHLNRAFARHVGLPPHRYQLQVRVERAKALLAAGAPPGDVARATGFADQSHLGRHFKRLVGVPPGRYGRDAPGRTRGIGDAAGGTRWTGARRSTDGGS